MTVYVITRGEYSDYHILFVTLDKKKAEALKEVYSTKYDECEIEEFEAVEDSVKVIRKPVWKAEFLYTTHIGMVLDSVTRANYYYKDHIEEKDYEFFVYVSAPNKERAIKIASDRLSKYLAEKQGL